jgi:hypothetical protein
MTRQSNFNWRSGQLGLLLPFAACGLTGCQGSAPTLSMQNPPAKTHANSSEPHKSEFDIPASVAPQAEVPAPVSDPEWTPLLTKVDPAQLLGSWQDSFFGTRTLTLNADGTARMQLDFDLAASLLYGQQLDLDMKWRLEGAVVKADIITGDPADAATLVMRDWGTHHIFLLDRVEPEIIQMRDPEHTLKHTLRRVH